MITISSTSTTITINDNNDDNKCWVLGAESAGCWSAGVLECWVLRVLRVPRVLRVLGVESAGCRWWCRWWWCRWWC